VLRRWVASYFDASAAEKAALWALVDAVKLILDTHLHPQGYDVRFATEELTQPQPAPVHIHVIPRFREGVQAARSLRHAARRPPLATGSAHDPFGDHLWPLFASATEVAIVAAFVTETGLALLEKRVFAALRRGANFRIVTGDYLGFNQVDALRQLLGWSQLEVRDADEASEGPPPGRLGVRVVETALADGSVRAFHPKSWLFEASDFGVAFVGSSNVSRSALGSGIEWNLRVERAIDATAYAAVCAAVDGLWGTALELSADWIEAYARRMSQAARSLGPGEAELETLEPPPAAHEFQEEALLALAGAREQGRRRALVVLATGLGKTWLAAFDVASFARATGRWPRVLFLAHREELLAQAARTFRRLLVAAGQPARVGWCAGELMQPDADLVVASIQKLCRAEHLERIVAQRFDYVIVDEAHHAEAASYRRLLDRLDPAFLLGLTATPDRADQGDILGIFDDFVAYRADLGVGIQKGRLVPFAYHGVRDDIDYAHIPWRNRRFDPTLLAAAAQTRSRMQRVWRAWGEHPGTRTLVFCCSIEHARFAASWLGEQGVRVDSVFAGPDSGDRAECLEQLERGELDALCVVDMFNEGVDIPAVDRVVMLRPTESPVVFLQQLGRGLRQSAGKERLTVIDFVGNHRMFLDRLRRLLSLVASRTSLHAYLGEDAPPELPPGCSVELELEVKELLLAFLPRGALEVERVYRELVLGRGTRPSLGELYRMGYRPSVLRKAHAGWFRFVAEEGDLDADETRLLDALGDWLEELETGAMPNSFKLVLLEVLLEADALTTGLPLDELAQRSLAFIQRSPELQRDLEGIGPFNDPAAPQPAEWLSFWLQYPVADWTRGRGWFAIEGQRFVPRRLLVPSGLEEPLARMTRELIDYRLAMYRARSSDDVPGASFSCIVLRNTRDPILKLPRRVADAMLPSGETDVRLADGSVWSFRFAKEYCNVARPVGTDRNRLPDLLRGWFGPAAGRPGTRFQVQFSRSPDGWWIQPRGELLPVHARGQLLAYPSLRAAAGATSTALTDEPLPEPVTLPLDTASDHLFAVRASGESMNGGKAPIADGDWLVMRWARGAAVSSLAGRVVLVQTPDAQDGFAYQVKRIVRDAERWWLRSDNPQHPSLEATAETTPIARLESTIRPESLGPALGERLTPDDVGAAFGLSSMTALEQTGRHTGHLFLVVSEQGHFSEPDRLDTVITDRRPGETAFVLTRSEPGAPLRYCGVARWLEPDGPWRLPALDFATWRALGNRLGCSRRLPSGALDAARTFLDQLLLRAPAGTWLERDGKRCRIVERMPRGVRVDGGPGGFAARQVSLTDLAWVMLAAQGVSAEGGLLDEARVNRLRYLEGTPKGSTRWIDTGWALTLFRGVVSG
jgi:superfamily II DNA or RNA helicase/HKD family nuclease